VRLSPCAQVMSIVPNKKEIGKLFKKDAKLLCESLEVSPPPVSFAHFFLLFLLLLLLLLRLPSLSR